ncbi:MAG: hypothetical protein K2O00_03680 [Muribaculaceae bacterium]|nr:hypothetical protein [Muribaculaceae bacterium]
MELEPIDSGLGNSINAGDKNVKLIRIVAEWWRAACYLQENRSRFEPNELEAFEYILKTPERGTVDEDKFGTSVILLRELSYQYSDQFGAEASNFAGKSNKILRDIKEFAETLESQRMKASAGVNVNAIKRNAPAMSLGGSNSGTTVTIGAAKHTGPANPAAGKTGGNDERRTINGNVWVGSFDSKGQPYGNGTIFYADGSIYTGQWSPAGPHGNGKITQTDGDVWEALFRNGKPVDGKILYANGNRYEGGLNENGRNGIGRTFTESYEESGQYLDDSRVGNGKIMFKNGDFYEGGWNDKGPHGRGTLFDSVNKRTDTGDFVNGKRNGHGRMVWGVSKICYEGTWMDTPQGINGTGVTYTLPNGPRTPVRYYQSKPMRITPGGAPPPNPRPAYGAQRQVIDNSKRPSSVRNVFAILGGIFFGFLTALFFLDQYPAFFFCAACVVGLQFLFAGNYNSKTQTITKKGMNSPVSLTGLMFLLVGVAELTNSFGSFIIHIIIGLILLIFGNKK